jgi:hypothetical protein
MASEDYVYGERLLSYLNKLSDQGFISEKWVEIAYVYSVDWPQGMAI